MTLREKAKQFAHEAHDSIGQKRKYNDEPYWVHTDAVAETVASVLPSDEEAIAAAHLHDVVEDVFPLNKEYSIFRITREFGERVAQLVTELTDVYTKEAWPKLNRATRKSLERERVAKISVTGKTIKLADFLDNTASIVKDDKDFAQVYLKEKLALLPYLSDGNPQLLQRVSMQTIAACAECGIEIPVISK